MIINKSFLKSNFNQDVLIKVSGFMGKDKEKVYKFFPIRVNIQVNGKTIK